VRRSTLATASPRRGSSSGGTRRRWRPPAAGNAAPATTWGNALGKIAPAARVEQDGLPCRRPAPLQQAARATAGPPPATAGAGARARPRRAVAPDGSRKPRRRPRPPPPAGGAGCWPAARRETGDRATAACRRHAAAAQGLDPGPQGIARAARKHQAQAVEPDAGGGPGRRMGRMRRRHQHHGLPGAGQRASAGSSRPSSPMPSCPAAVRSMPRAASRRRAVRHRGRESRWQESAPAPRRRRRRAGSRRSSARE
jgi:hypothetical protein